MRSDMLVNLCGNHVVFRSINLTFNSGFCHVEYALRCLKSPSEFHFSPLSARSISKVNARRAMVNFISTHDRLRQKSQLPHCLYLQRGEVLTLCQYILAAQEKMVGSHLSRHPCTHCLSIALEYSCLDIESSQDYDVRTSC